MWFFSCLLCRLFTLDIVLTTLTRTAPHLRQVTVHLPGLFAQLHHISAQSVWSDWNLSKMLVIVTEVYCQEHLCNKREGKRERKRGREVQNDRQHVKWCEIKWFKHDLLQLCMYIIIICIFGYFPAIYWTFFLMQPLRFFLGLTTSWIYYNLEKAFLQ